MHDGHGRYSIDLLPADAGGIARLILAGEFDIAPSQALGAIVAPLREAGTPLIVDLRGLTFLDSFGTCTLMQLTTSEDWDVRMIQPTGSAWRVMGLCGVQDALPWIATA